MKRIFTLLIISLLFISCGKDKEKETGEEQPVPQENLQQEPISEPVPASTPDVLVYTVQIGAFTKANAKFESIPGVNIYKEEGLTKYRLGSFGSYREARRSRSELLEAYPDAFVQALKNDTPLNIRRALAEFN